MTTRWIRYDTPIRFRAATHAQLEHFDNKPPPQPLEELESAATTAMKTAEKYPGWIPDRRRGWDGTVTKYDASTMYLG
jgi:hypothetical protein